MILTQEKAAELREIMPPKYERVTSDKMLPLSEGNWNDYSTMKRLTCVNHPWAAWITKNPWTRNLHYVQGPQGVDAMIESECECSFSALRFVKDVS